MQKKNLKSAKSKLEVERELIAMKKDLLFKTILLIAFILTIISLITHNEMALIISAILMLYCVMSTFTKKQD